MSNDERSTFEAAGQSLFAELSHYELHPPSIRLLPRAFCRRHGLVVLGRVDCKDDGPVSVGAIHPEEAVALDTAARMLGRPIELVRLNRYEIDRALRVGFEGPSSEAAEEGMHVVDLAARPARPLAEPRDLVDELLRGAIEAGASDIHLETFFADVDVRYRVDGILHQVYTDVSPDNVAGVISRIKVMASLDIAERRRPQDGRFRCLFKDGDRYAAVDFRVSVIPSPSNEDVVLRVLDSSQGLRSVEQLGMAPDVRETLLRLLENPEGLLVVTAPTSGGKTTTLYAALSEIADGARKIVTAEDPVEYCIDRINQKQVSEQMPWPVLLRALLRHNPDVIFFGEIRDLETASTALTAAATGHLVLGTLHTSDAVGAVVRLRGLGVENTDIAASLVGVLGQRLVRSVCASCAARVTPTLEQQRLFGPLIEGMELRAGSGCPECRQTGYRGRTGVYELLVVDEQLQDLIGDGAHRLDLRRHAAAQGFRTMTHDALAKAGAGLTTLDEIVRVVPYRQIVAVRADAEG
jgi:type II secretory ATPase GspE/PulE/Tfp pilus assembly ATPase PilB-like protein